MVDGSVAVLEHALVTSRLKRILSIIVAVAFLACAIPTVIGSYRFKYAHPEELQEELLGHTIAFRGDLIRFDPNIEGFGLANFRWVYRFPDSPALRRMCTSYDRGACIIRYVWTNDRDVSISFANNELTVAENWF